LASLVLEHISKRLGGQVVIENLDLEVASGELVCLLGASGSGKTTILRMVGGFLPVDQGRIRIDGKDVTEVPPERRPTGMVFQSYALWPNMDVVGNISYGLRVRRVARPEIRDRVAAVLALVGLQGQDKKFPSQLSGGQQQRVALARSLVLEPAVLLLDEPLSNLDAKLRERVREDIRAIQQRAGTTTVFVTHDQEEAMSISDRVAVLEAGKIEQYEAPGELYRRPASMHVATFIGTMNRFPAYAEAQGVRIGSALVPCPVVPDVGAAPFDLCVRPEDVVLDAPGGVEAMLERRMPRGHYEELVLASPFGPLRVFAPSGESGLGVGEGTRIAFERVLAYRDGRLLPGQDAEVAAGRAARRQPVPSGGFVQGGRL
jgi:putative spermidine/putrescine transport system ATP-binding protein